jgi:hypothetical protein
MAVYASAFLTVLIALKLFPVSIRLPEWIPNLSRGLFPPVTSQYHAILQTHPCFFLSNWAWYVWLGLLAPFAISDCFRATRATSLPRRHGAALPVAHHLRNLVHGLGGNHRAPEEPCRNNG